MNFRELKWVTQITIVASVSTEARIRFYMHCEDIAKLMGIWYLYTGYQGQIKWLVISKLINSVDGLAILSSLQPDTIVFSLQTLLSVLQLVILFSLFYVFQTVYSTRPSMAISGNAFDYLVCYVGLSQDLIRRISPPSLYVFKQWHPGEHGPRICSIS